MNPGRELDEIVAKAMGWRWDYLYPNSLFPSWIGPDGQPVEDNEVPNFSTDWAAAGQALEWLSKNQPWSDGIVLSKIDGEPAIGNQIRGDALIVAIGETFLHVIALAVVEAAKEIGVRDEPKQALHS